MTERSSKYPKDLKASPTLQRRAFPAMGSHPKPEAKPEALQRAARGGHQQ